MTDLLLHRRLMAAQSAIEKYTFLEYLGYSGNVSVPGSVYSDPDKNKNFTETGFSPSCHYEDEPVVECEFLIPSDAPNGVIYHLAQANSTNDFSMFLYFKAGDGLYANCRSGIVRTLTKIKSVSDADFFDTKHLIIHDRDTASLDGGNSVSIYTSTGNYWNFDNSIGVFNGVQFIYTSGKAIIYTLNRKIGGVYTNKLKPARRNEDGLYGFYDEIQDIFNPARMGGQNVNGELILPE